MLPFGCSATRMMLKSTAAWVAAVLLSLQVHAQSPVMENGVDLGFLEALEAEAGDCLEAAEEEASLYTYSQVYRRLWWQERLFMLYVNVTRIVCLRQPLTGVGTWKMHKGAAEHSRDMEKSGRFGHYNIRRREREYHFRGENIIMGCEGPYDCYLEWMDSQGHRQNILDRRYWFTGIGFVRRVSIRQENGEGRKGKTVTKGRIYGTHVFR